MFRNTAHVYDLIYASKDYAAEAGQVHDLVRARYPEASSLLDVACGTGRHLVHLRDWYQVVGVDADPGMLGHARGRLPGVRLLEADMRSLALDTTFDVVVCLFSSIGYMATTQELDTAVEAMANHLVPGGVLVLDGWVRPEAWRGESSSHVDTAADDTIKVARVGVATRHGNKTHLEMHHLIATGDSVEHLVDHHDLTLFEATEYTGAFAKAGLDVQIVDGPMPDRDRYVGVRTNS